MREATHFGVGPELIIRDNDGYSSAWRPSPWLSGGGVTVRMGVVAKTGRQHQWSRQLTQHATRVMPCGMVKQDPQS